MNNGHFVHLIDKPDVVIVKPNGLLIFYPINETSYDDLIHNNNYRCIANYGFGILASKNIKIKAGKLNVLFAIISIN